MYQFPEMKQPARSELPILRAAPVIADIMRKPAGRAGEMKRPAGAKKRPAAVLDAAENAEDDVVMIVAGDAEEEDDHAEGAGHAHTVSTKMLMKGVP